MNITVRKAKAGDQRRWDGFCNEHRASYAAYFYWRDILPELGYKPVFLLAEDSEKRICGILPAALSKMPFRHYAQSTIADGRMYAGPIVLDGKVLKKLITEFDAFCKVEGVTWSLIISGPPYGVEPPTWDRVLDMCGYQPDCREESRKRHTFLLDLKVGYETIFNNFSSNFRNQIRKGFKIGLEVVRDQWHYADQYFSLKRTTWNRLKNLPPGRDEHITITRNIRRNGVMYIALVKGKVVGGLYCYKTPETWFLKGAVYDYSYHNYNVNSIMYAKSIEDACNAGAGFYDFGSTPPPGTSHFTWKNRFRGTPYPLTFYRKVYKPRLYFMRRAIKRATIPLVRFTARKAGHRLERIVAWYEE